MLTAVSTRNAPAAIGPYSQAISGATLVFTSGQLPICPETGKLVTGGVEEQARQSLTNIRQILAAAGATMNDVVKTTVFLADMDDFDKVNNVYKSYFAATPPARSCIQVARLPKDAAVEIEAIALLPGASAQ